MFGTAQRDPMLDLLHHLEHRIGRTFNEPFRASEWPVPEAVTTAWLPLVDIFEEPDVIRLVAELPGVSPSDVKISVESNLLTIKGTKQQVAEEKAEKVHRYERTYGGLERCEQDQGDLRPRRADDHAAEGGDGQASPDHGGGHAGEGLVERLTLRIRGRSIMATATKTRLKVFPLADRVAIRPLEETEEMKGGLYIPDTAKEKPIQGEVIAVGPGRMEKGQRVPMELKVGDRVVYGKYTGSQVELDEEEIILIKESDVIAKLS